VTTFRPERSAEAPCARGLRRPLRPEGRHRLLAL